MRWLQLLLVLLLVPLAACSLNGKMSSYPVEASGPYTLDGGDVIAVAVYGDDSLSKTYKVDDTGTVSLPLVGPVPVRGLTVNQAAGAIAAALANGFMRNPNVAVQIDTYRPFYIQGAVKNGGQFAYVPGMTIRAAISTAGGYSDTANRSRATIYRRQGAQMIKSNVGLDFPIYPGDTIVIAERWL
ncbi:MAG TPA: polysaccharide biosynthesis/export family protein [Devosia sp.]|nr:polysaccharide biosynthesis/export family protein [Devosia sp.]